MAFYIAKSSHTHGASFFHNDNRASGGKHDEADVKSCSHCQALVRLDKVEHFCAKCEHPVCGPCATKLLSEGCAPFRQKIDQALEAQARRRQFKRVAGIE